MECGRGPSAFFGEGCGDADRSRDGFHSAREQVVRTTGCAIWRTVCRLAPCGVVHGKEVSSHRVSGVSEFSCRILFFHAAKLDRRERTARRACRRGTIPGTVGNVKEMECGRGPSAFFGEGCGSLARVMVFTAHGSKSSAPPDARSGELSAGARPVVVVHGKEVSSRQRSERGFSRAVSSSFTRRSSIDGSGRHGALVDEARSLGLSGTRKRWNAAGGHPHFLEKDAGMRIARSMVFTAHGSKSTAPPDARSGELSAGARPVVVVHGKEVSSHRVSGVSEFSCRILFFHAAKLDRRERAAWRACRRGTIPGTVGNAKEMECGRRSPCINLPPGVFGGRWAGGARPDGGAPGLAIPHDRSSLRSAALPVSAVQHGEPVIVAELRVGDVHGFGQGAAVGGEHGGIRHRQRAAVVGDPADEPGG